MDEVIGLKGNDTVNDGSKVEEKSELAKGLCFTSATALVVGSAIGSGIFIAPSIMAGKIASPGIIILLFIIAGIFTLFGALSYAELSSSMPKAGGQYIYLREAFSPVLSFLYGWGVFLVIQSGLIAAVAIAFAKYLGIFIPFVPFIPPISESNILFSVYLINNIKLDINTAQIVGILSIIVLTFINFFGVKLGGLVQRIFTFLKVGAIILLIVLGFLIGKGSFSNLQPFFLPQGSILNIVLLSAIAVAMSKALFAYDGWNTVTFTAEEVHEPQKNLPRALIAGTLIITALYALATAVYFYLIPVGQAMAIPDNRIAANAAQIIFGNAGLFFIAAAILISTFGCNNGLILGGPRVYYAMAKDGLFFKSFSEIHSKYKTPIKGLIWQLIWTIILILTGTYDDLLTYVTFASALFGALTVAGVFILRKKRPDMERPYLTSGYPWTPAIFILIAIAFLAFIVIGDPINSYKGLGVLLLGLPVYWWFNKKAAKEETEQV